MTEQTWQERLIKLGDLGGDVQYLEVVKFFEAELATARSEGAERERERIEKLIGGALQGETLRGMTLFKLKQIFYKETTHAE